MIKKIKKNKKKYSLISENFVFLSLLLGAPIQLSAATSNTNAIIECTGVGYKIAGSSPSTVFAVDSNNPIPQSYISGINLTTSAMGYSLSHGLLYVVDSDNDMKLTSIDENGVTM